MTLNYRYNLKELITILEENKELDTFIRDIFRFNLICDENFGVEEILFDPHLQDDNKLKYLEEIFKGHVGTFFYDFIYQLIKNNDIEFYKMISKKFITLIGQEKNCSFIQIISATPIQEQQMAEIKGHLERIEKRSVFIYNSLSKKILGGFVINCSDRLLDLSVQGDFEKLKVQLTHSK